MAVAVPGTRCAWSGICLACLACLGSRDGQPPWSAYIIDACARRAAENWVERSSPELHDLAQLAPFGPESRNICRIKSGPWPSFHRPSRVRILRVFLRSCVCQKGVD